MKTFDEAIAIAIPTFRIPNGRPIKETIESLECIVPLRQRYDSLSMDARDNKDYLQLSAQLQISTSAGVLAPQDAILTAFVTGVVVGCEMEKSETGGIDLTSLPPERVHLEAPIEELLPAEPTEKPAVAERSEMFIDGVEIRTVTDIEFHAKPSEMPGEVTLPDVRVGNSAGEVLNGLRPHVRVGFQFFMSDDTLFLLVTGSRSTITKDGEFLEMETEVSTVGIPLEAPHLQTLVDQARQVADNIGIVLT